MKDERMSNLNLVASPVFENIVMSVQCSVHVYVVITRLLLSILASGTSHLLNALTTRIKLIKIKRL